MERDVLVTPAFAQATGSGSGPNDAIMQLVPFICVILIMYFLIMRPQQKKAKAHAEMVKNLRRNDVVVMGSGMVGKITKIIDDNEVEVEISDGVKVRFLRSMVLEVRSKTEPVSSAS